MRRSLLGAAARGLRLLPLVFFVGLGACDALDDALNVDAPGVVPAEGLATPQNAELLLNGAVGDFECAFGAYVALTSVMAREMTDATQTAARWPYDRRNVSPSDGIYASSGCTGLGVYTPLSTAQWSADNILGHLQVWSDAEVPNRQRMIATAAAYSGYAHLLLGEGFCSVALDLSAELTSAQVMDTAIARFDVAIQAAQASNTADILNMARVGKARALLDLGRKSEAAAVARQVPADFVKVVTASATTSRRYNRVFAQNGEGSSGGSALSVGPDYRSVTHAGVPDPRVPVKNANRVNADGTPLFWQKKYNALGTPLPLATGDEAQLIIAEAEGGASAVAIINAFHARAGLPPFVSADPAAIQAHVIDERRSELWLEGHRFFDIRRLNLPLDPAPGTPHPKGGSYGADRCFPLPDVERRNNPNIPG